MKERMAELAARFLERSRGDIAAMREALAGLDAGQEGPLDELRHLAHRMVGTGATLGFTGLSELASRIEELADAQPPGQVPGADARRQLAGAIDSLDAGLRQQQAF